MTGVPVSQVFRAAADAAPKANALQFEQLSLDYARVRADVDRVAVALAQSGVNSGDIVAVHVRKPLTHWIVTLGLLRIGAVTLSLTDNFAAELDALPQVSTVICAPAGEEVPAYPATLRRIHVDPLWLSEGPAEATALPAPEVAARTAGRICFTSGTSGRPKAIRFDSNLLADRVAASARKTRLGPASVFWCGLGPDTAYGFTATLAAWQAGASVILSDGAAGTYAKMLRGGLNLILASPAALRPLIRDAAAAGLAPMNGPIIVAGGRLSVELRDDARTHLGGRVHVAYGSSEAGGLTLGDADGLDIHPGQAGPILDDMEAEVVDESGTVQSPDTQGLIRFRSSSTVPGYINDDLVTKMNFHDGWFYPGDLGRISESGILTVLGRPTDVLNFGGVKVRADEIEDRIRAIDTVEDACVLQLPAATDGTDVAILVAGPGARGGQIGAAIRAAVPTLPRFRLIALPALPRGSMGKFNRPALTETVAAVTGPAEPDGTGDRATFVGIF